jgi:hypothetical protein
MLKVSESVQDITEMTGSSSASCDVISPSPRSAAAGLIVICFDQELDPIDRCEWLN